MSYKFPPQLFLRFVLAPLPTCPFHLQIIFRVCSLELCRQHHRGQTTNSRFLRRGSILAEQLSSRSLLPNTMILHQHLHSTRTNARFPLPSCNHQESNETALLVIFIRNPKIHFTKLTTGRANLTQNGTPENSPTFSSLPSPLLTHKASHTLNQC